MGLEYLPKKKSYCILKYTGGETAGEVLWGTDWGKKGYFQIRKGNDECGMRVCIGHLYIDVHEMCNIIINNVYSPNLNLLLNRPSQLINLQGVCCPSGLDIHDVVCKAC